MQAEAAIKQRWEVLRGVLDERQRRLLVGVEARILGRGGISAVAAATGVSRSTVSAGLGEIDALTASAAAAEADAPPVARMRRPGGGRKKLVDKDPTLVPDLLALVNPLPRSVNPPRTALECTMLAVSITLSALASGDGWPVRRLPAVLACNRRPVDRSSRPCPTSEGLMPPGKTTPSRIFLILRGGSRRTW